MFKNLFSSPIAAALFCFKVFYDWLTVVWSVFLAPPPTHKSSSHILHTNFMHLFAILRELSFFHPDCTTNSCVQACHCFSLSLIAHPLVSPSLFFNSWATGLTFIAPLFPSMGGSISCFLIFWRNFPVSNHMYTYIRRIHTEALYVCMLPSINIYLSIYLSLHPSIFLVSSSSNSLFVQTLSEQGDRKIRLVFAWEKDSEWVKEQEKLN